ncbi:hypothetical protein HOY80DRAFT_1132947 [Tuber brumale]|nr:hypothetical protein HOY80DRAFT_1132947 [Tuber brumale]
MSTDQPRESSHLFKTPDNNQSQFQHHRFRTPDTPDTNVPKSTENTENTDSSPANIILHLLDADHVETMSSAELRTRTGGQIFFTKPVDVFQPTGKPRERQGENREDSWLCRPRDGLGIRTRRNNNLGAITPTRAAVRRGVLRGRGPDERRCGLGGVAECDEGEEDSESVDLLETPDGEYTRDAEPYCETDDLDDVLMEEVDQGEGISQM